MPHSYAIDILCFQESESIFRMCPRVRHVFIVPRDKYGLCKILEYFKIYLTMSKLSYDFIAQFSDDWRGAFITRLLSPKLSVARESKKRPLIWAKFFKKISKVCPTARHASEQDVDLLRLAGLFNNPIAPKYKILVEKSKNEAVSSWLKFNFKTTKTTKIIVVHASARWKFKTLPTYLWAKVIDRLIEKDFFVVLSGGPSDREFNNNIFKLCKKKPLVSENFDLEMTASLINKADLLISIDSMALHMASALQTKVLAIFGPTDERVWGPWQTQHIVIALNDKDAMSFSCRPCNLDGCGGSKSSECLNAIHEDKILNSVNKLI